MLARRALRWARSELLTLLGGAALAAITTIATYQNTADLRTALIVDQRELAASLVQAAARDLNRVALSIQTQFDDIDRALAAGAGGETLETALRVATLRNALLRDAAILDASGNVLYSSGQTQAGARVRDVPRAAEGGPGNRLAFGAPRAGRTLASDQEGGAQTYVPVFRAIANGGRAATLVATVTTASLSNEVGGLVAASGANLAVYLYDGTPLTGDAVGDDSRRIFAEYLPRREDGVFDVADPRYPHGAMVAFRVAPDQPLVAALRFSYTPIELRWRVESAGAFRVMGIALAAIAAFTGLVVFALRRYRTSEQALAGERNRLRDFAAVTAEWFWETDAQHRFTFLSDGIRAYGIEPESRLGRQPLTVEGDYQLESDVPVLSLLDKHQPFRGFVYSTDFGPLGRRSISVSGMALFDAAGVFTGFRGTAMDVTEAVEAKRRLIEAIRDAESANKAKSLFFASMSHEIRTPISGILGLAVLLEDGALDETQRRRVASIREAGEGLQQIINDILDLSKLEAGRMTLDRRAFDLRRIARASLALVEPRAAAKRLPLAIEIADDLPSRFEGDPNRIKQVLLNLLSNAVKFTEAGKVTLRAAGAPAGDGGWRIEFTVEDTGIGIAADKQVLLFRDFEQIDIEIVRKFGGTGLGLAICRRLIGGMGGEISVESEPGRGTKIRFALTLNAVLDGAHAAKSIEIDWTLELARLEQLRGRKPRALVAEDNEVNLMIATSYLEVLGIESSVARDGAAAVAAASGEVFDLILMDLQMPVMDGCEAAARIRGLGGAHASVPIVALTANTFEEDRQRAAAAGMTGFLSKPFQRGELAEAIVAALRPRAG